MKSGRRTIDGLVSMALSRGKDMERLDRSQTMRRLNAGRPLAALRRLVIPALVGILALFAGISHAWGQSGGSVAIYFFWGDGCPHCEEAKPVLEGLVRRYPGSELRAYEIWYSEGNAELFARIAKARGFAPRGVPTILIGERYWIGYSHSIAPQIEAALAACLRGGCPDAGAGALPTTGRDSVSAEPHLGVGSAEVVDLPLVGPVDLAGQSLWVSTALISFVDGFNPCSLWVLSILVALALHTGSRKTVLLIGLIFITVTAGVYALFIAGLFTVLSIISLGGWLRIVVALIALFFGAINIKDYFFYKKGLSFTIDDRSKPGIYQRMRRVIDASESFWGLAGATVVLAAGVSLIEFSCTAGFPVLWANLLAAQEVPALTFALLLLLYMIIYQLDELALFTAAVFTLKASRVEERQGRILKLIGGILMLTLAGVMVIDPALMNRLGTSLAIFGIAFAITGLVLLLHRKILPSFGIWMGDEAPRRTPRG
jgi:thiol-disulfide isomerase/thioredoxin